MCEYVAEKHDVNLRKLNKAISVGISELIILKNVTIYL